ncbi:WDGH domain-containing protein [Klebsiella pneumoniae]
MSNMVFRHGNSADWKGIGYDWVIVSDEELQEYLDAGWVDHPSKVIAETAVEDITDKGEISDGYHTFNELYAHRVRLFSTLMRAFPEQSWWSFKHSTGEKWDGWVIAGIDTPDGAVTYHLPESEIPYLPDGSEIEFGKEWDGHAAEDVLLRLTGLHLPEPVQRKKPGPKPKAVSDADSN